VTACSANSDPSVGMRICRYMLHLSMLRISDLCVQFLEQNQFVRQSRSRSMSCSKQYLYSIVPGVCQPLKSNRDWVAGSRRLALPGLVQPALPSEVGLRRGGAE